MIAEILPRGRWNAIPAAAVQACTGLTRRELEDQVTAELKAGKAICYTNAGYYIPVWQDDFGICLDWYRRLMDRALSRGDFETRQKYAAIYSLLLLTRPKLRGPYFGTGAKQ